MKLNGLIASVVVILIWGITFVNTRALLGDFSALEILVVRFALAWAALWLVRPRQTIKRCRGDSQGTDPSSGVVVVWFGAAGC